MLLYFRALKTILDLKSGLEFCFWFFIGICVCVLLDKLSNLFGCIYIFVKRRHFMQFPQFRWASILFYEKQLDISDQASSSWGEGGLLPCFVKRQKILVEAENIKNLSDLRSNRGMLFIPCNCQRFRSGNYV